MPAMLAPSLFLLRLTSFYGGFALFRSVILLYTGRSEMPSPDCLSFYLLYYLLQTAVALCVMLAWGFVEEKMVVCSFAHRLNRSRKLK